MTYLKQGTDERKERESSARNQGGKGVCKGRKEENDKTRLEREGIQIENWIEKRVVR